MFRARTKRLVCTIAVITAIPFALFFMDSLSLGLKFLKGDHSRLSPRVMIVDDDRPVGVDDTILEEENLENEKADSDVIEPEPLSVTCRNDRKCNPTRSGMFNVHIVPHSHNDVGWKKTADQYYAGRGGGNAASFYNGAECSHCILDSVIPQLLKNPTRRFIFAEMAFFSRWFNEQDLKTRRAVRGLVAQGRLQIVSGGWSMSDSATTYYDDIINQHTLGFQWIQKEFGECAMSNIGWHIDQFGHSREHSSLFAQMGFDAIFLGRIDFQDHTRRIKSRDMETVWMTSPRNLGNSLFTSVLYDGYFSPASLAWEGRPPSTSKRIQKIEAKTLINLAVKWAESYKSSHILIPVGGDFAFRSAPNWYRALDQLIATVNAEQKVRQRRARFVLHSQLLHQQRQQGGCKVQHHVRRLPPVLHHPQHLLDRLLHQQTRTQAPCESGQQLTTDVQTAGCTCTPDSSKPGHRSVEESRFPPAAPSRGERACQYVISTAYRKLLTQKTKNLPTQHFCNHLNISVCHITETADKVFVTVFNPLGQPTSYWVRLPVTVHHFIITGPKSQATEAQIVPLTESTLRIPERGIKKPRVDVVFEANLPPFGFAVYKLETDDDATLIPPQEEIGTGRYYITNQYLSLTIDPRTGVPQTLRNKEIGVDIKLEQRYLYYLTSAGQARDPNDRTGGFLGSHKRTSGAYAFVPKEFSRPVPLKGPSSRGVKVHAYKGPNVQEIRQEFSPWVSQVIRLYNGAPYLELEWTVGPIPENMQGTKEVISRFTTDLNTNGMFYTDSNGRETILRRRDYRETWSLNVTSPVSGNYYPVTARMFLRDEERNIQLTVLTDRCQGGSSLSDGQMELMVHRRTFRDDDLGVEEPLNERGEDGRGLVLRGKHYVFLNTIAKAAREYRALGLQVHHPPTVSFMQPDPPTTNHLVTSFSGLRNPLPFNVHLLTLDQTPGDPDTLILRLENFLEVGEADEDEEEATVTLQYLFSRFDITTVRELSLGADHNITRVRRLQWNTTDGTTTSGTLEYADSRDVHSPPFPILLRPMEIRTFRVTTGPATEPPSDNGV
ncbi:lysosomal alpha-mannosidase-like [Haliotis rubra]|uniref:lysosomal alpha-mannosidase-like n=1 Tax=Haliotis rubra TaxID=36100 RepID=UPI001EE50CC6|nr:lysosomal alpha-mannosidase-like [Haliotis rubra]